MAESVTNTKAKFNLALCSVPRIRTAATTSTFKTAGRLISPPSAGVLSRISGMIHPYDFNTPARYPENPTATALPVTVYAKRSDQPQRNANPSPSEANV